MILNDNLLKKVLVMVLAGGQGERLYPLTKDRAKPAVPFGGIYRIIDFTLSNCVNSELFVSMLTSPLNMIGAGPFISRQRSRDTKAHGPQATRQAPGYWMRNRFITPGNFQELSLV